MLFYREMEYNPFMLNHLTDPNKRYNSYSFLYRKIRFMNNVTIPLIHMNLVCLENIMPI